MGKFEAKIRRGAVKRRRQRNWAKSGKAEGISREARESEAMAGPREEASGREEASRRELEVLGDQDEGESGGGVEQLDLELGWPEWRPDDVPKPEWQQGHPGVVEATRQGRRCSMRALGFAIGLHRPSCCSAAGQRQFCRFGVGEHLAVVVELAGSPGQCKDASSPR